MNIEEELKKLQTIVNNNTIMKNEFDKYYKFHMPYKGRERICYIRFVLQMTKQYPLIETYLEKLLTKYTADELEKCSSNQTILHHMVYDIDNVSLNSFEMIINFGINVEKKDDYGYTVLHDLYVYCENLEYITSLTNLFVKHGADVNCIVDASHTILDLVTYSYSFEKQKIMIPLLMDFGAITNKPDKTKKKVLEFIESYKCQPIKPAIRK